MSELKSLCRAYSSLFFMDNIFLGLCLALATFFYPDIGFSGLLGLVFATLFSKLLKIHKAAHYGQCILYNSLLIGLFTGHLFRLSILSVVLLAIVIGLLIMITIVLDVIFRNYEVPVLSLPFAIIAILLALIITQFSGLRDATPYFIDRGMFLENYLPDIIMHFFRSLGSILCITDALFGGIVFLIVALHSPLMAIFLILGFLVGYEAEMIFKYDATPALDSHFFNYSLIFACLSTVFIFPSLKSIITATVATIIASFVVIASLTFWNLHSAPITALPFNLIVILVIRTLRSVSPLQLSNSYVKTPEETIDQSRVNQLRHNLNEVGVFCPFENEWQIQQGFDGEWTHLGPWKHALDFVKLGPDQDKTYNNEGFELSDYYAFSEPVLSPMNGYVVGLISNLNDNRIGSVDNQNNWGNYVVIQSYGVYALLAHLKKDSIKVKIGDYITAGKKLGECGNSGYSKEPHLHLQLQYSYIAGAHTIPFHLLNYSSGKDIYFNGLPKVKDIIKPLPKNTELDMALTFKIGDVLKYNLKINGQRKKDVNIDIRLDEITGYLYLSEENSAKLYFNKIGTQFYFYGFEGSSSSALADLFLAAPKIPITYGGSFDFQDHLPLNITDNFLSRWIKVISTFFSAKEKNWHRDYNFNSNLLEITGKNKVKGHTNNTIFNLDPILGIMKFTIEGRIYERVR